MSILNCRLRVEGSRLRISKEYKREYTHEYLIETDDPDMLMGSVLTETALLVVAGSDPFPSLWDAYDVRDDSDDGAFLQDIDCSRYLDKDDERFFWKAVCIWRAPDNGNGADSHPAANPVNDPIRWHAEFSQFTRKITRDVDDDRLIANSAGDLYDDVEIDDGRVILTGYKNYAASDFLTLVGQMREFSNSVNNAEYMGLAKATIKMDSIAMSELQSRESIDYYQMTYRMQLCSEAENSWHMRLENKGSMAYDKPKDEDGAVKKRVTVLEGVNKGELRDYAYLAYDGTQQIDLAEPLPIPESGDEPFHKYKEKNWALLQLFGEP